MMKLSAPIYHLKRNAKQLARQKRVAHNTALDQVAAREGFSSWSQLAARHASRSPAETLYAGLNDGELMLIGARPGQGKTRLALEIAVAAVKSGHNSMFFTLEYTQDDVHRLLEAIGTERSQLGGAFGIDCSDDISADYIIDKLASALPGMVVVIDYLQLLDQKRNHPPLAEQVASLKAFAERRQVAFIFVSQIARSYDPAEKPSPDLDDVRLPNPVDLTLFSKTCFINGGSVHLAEAVSR